MCIIIGLCIVATKGVLKRIGSFKVFLFTGIISVWAYIWLLIIIRVSSPGVVEVWEALVTLLHQPVFVFVANGIDTDWQARLHSAPRLASLPCS